MAAIAADQTVVLVYAWPRCTGPVVLMGRLVLTPDRWEGEGFAACQACGAVLFLAIRPAAIEGGEVGG